MGNLLSYYKKSVFDEIANNISSNTSQYYVFASNPIEYIDDVPILKTDNYSSIFEFDWNMMFGKKVKVTDVMPVIKKNIWTANTVYDKYDNTSEEIYTKDNYYVITTPNTNGGYYNVYKCINNANGAPSTKKPELVQDRPFETEDKYEWRYITSISSNIFDKFSTENYAPIYANSALSTESGVDSVVVYDEGSNYVNYYSGGLVVGISNTTVIKIDKNSSGDAISDQSNFYANSTLFIYNPTNASPQIRTIKKYEIVTNGNNSEKRIHVYENEPLNVTLINPGSTRFSISPRVVFETDGTSQPLAISTVNPVTNTISSVKVYERGSDITWANVSITSRDGAGAKSYAVISPPGGHGKDPAAELNIKGFCVSFSFLKDEDNKIPTNVKYNKIGLIKNPYVANSTNGKTDTKYSSNTFNTLLKANVTNEFTQGEIVVGKESKARGIVAFSNSSQIFLTGDKKFKNNEIITGINTGVESKITITSRGDIYTKDIGPLYVQNINNVTRQNNQSESFKLIIKL